MKIYVSIVENQIMKMNNTRFIFPEFINTIISLLKLFKMLKSSIKK